MNVNYEYSRQGSGNSDLENDFEESEISSQGPRRRSNEGMGNDYSSDPDADDFQPSSGLGGPGNRRQSDLDDDDDESTFDNDDSLDEELGNDYGSDPDADDLDDDTE